ncbi:MAG: hypothetical protein HQ519_00105 [Planctomycetes bacterium]|nr:hypothetical protein [Planctomycetota bacterium]
MRAMLHDGEHAEIGSKLTVPVDQANRLMHCNKAMPYESEDDQAAADKVIDPMVKSAKAAAEARSVPAGTSPQNTKQLKEMAGTIADLQEKVEAFDGIGEAVELVITKVNELAETVEGLAKAKAETKAKK